MRLLLLALLAAASAQAAPLTDVAAVGAGSAHTCAVTLSGAVYCWGDNGQGQLGTGDTVSRALPTPVIGLPSPIVAIALGGYHTCALSSSGGTYCWGQNGLGEIGSPPGNSATPVGVRGLSSGVAALTAGHDHSCALLSTGGVKCWGGNTYGQLGNGATSNQATPTPVDVVGLTGAASVAAGLRYTCALTTAGAVKCWGDNANYTLGYQTQASYATLPHDADGMSSGVSAMDAGFTHACAAFAAGGAKCWGFGTTGELGNPSNVYASLPIPVAELDQPLSALALGQYHTCGLTQQGSVKCWGNNFRHQLGYGIDYRVQHWTPVDASISNDALSISAGFQTTCAVMSDRTVRCWGLDSAHQLGTTQPFTGEPATVGDVSMQTIRFLPLAAKMLGEAPFSISASSDSGLPVTFASLTPAVCSVSGSTVTLAATGVCTVAATQPGNSAFGAATVLRRFPVLAAPAPQRLANISTRMQVLTGDNVLIGGFVVSGSPKTVVVRALGPSLSAFVAAPLANPRIDIFQGQNVIASNDDWQSDRYASSLMGMGFAPGNPAEAALVMTLQPGPYTAIVRGVNDATGVGLLEIYEADREDAPLVNISTRGRVDEGENVMIAGFVISGLSPKKVAVTGKGPSLQSAGIANPLGDPALTLVRQSDGAVIAVNGDWQSGPNAAELQSLNLAPSNSKESALLLTLPPGAYTAILSVENRASPGVGIVEVYSVPD